MEINLKIMLSSKVSIAKELISQTLSRVQALSGSRAPEIYNVVVNDNAAELKIWYWINDMSMQQIIHSDIVNSLYDVFEKNEVKIL